MSDHIVSVDPLVIEIERLRKQLAAERERSEGFKRELGAALSDLAAEREKAARRRYRERP